MASSSVTITTQKGLLRKYGGTRADVRSKSRYYLNMTKEAFLTQHPTCTEEDYHTMQVSTSFNKN